MEATCADLKRSSICASVSWHMRPAKKRRPSSLMVGSPRPSCAERLLLSCAWQTGQSASFIPGEPVFFQSFLLVQFCKFIFAPSLLVNRPPPPKLAPTSCTIIFESAQVVVKGLVD